jgi:hypothetical protein
MSSRKSTKTGGRAYGGSTDTPTPGTTLHICDAETPGIYRGTGMPAQTSGDYAPKIPNNPTYEPYEDAARMENKNRRG